MVAVDRGKLSDAEQALVKSEILSAAGQYWKGKSENCDPGDAYGLRIEPAFAQGFFTKPQTNQKAVLYAYCMTGHNFANNGIVVLEAGHVVAHIVYSGGWEQGISALPDINGNSQAKILITTGGFAMGTSWEVISIIGLSDRGVREFGHTETYSGDCEAGSAGFRPKSEKGTETTYRLFVRKGPTPGFYRETFIGDCGEPTKWRKSRTREKITLEGATQASVRYFRLK